MQMEEDGRHGTALQMLVANVKNKKPLDRETYLFLRHSVIEVKVDAKQVCLAQLLSRWLVESL
jgi:hypothetical protein